MQMEKGVGVSLGYSGARSPCQELWESSTDCNEPWDAAALGWVTAPEPQCGLMRLPPTGPGCRTEVLQEQPGLISEHPQRQQESTGHRPCTPLRGNGAHMMLTGEMAWKERHIVWKKEKAGQKA